MLNFLQLKRRKTKPLLWVFCSLFSYISFAAIIQNESISEDQTRAAIVVVKGGGVRTYKLTSNAKLRDNRPPDKEVIFSETPDHAAVRTGNVMFDGLYAMAVHEALQNSVSQIKDGAYDNGAPIRLEAFQTGEFWTYVWTRDLSYSVYLGLAQFDPQRAVSSLLFKTSELKPSVSDGYRNQIIQDTGSGGSYPVSSDRIVWVLGADETLKYLPDDAREKFLRQVYPILHDTIEQDRQLVYDAHDGLYRGEQSFLDWREQTYPGWTKDNVLPIAMSKALSVNSANYFLLTTASVYAGRLGQIADATRYAQWAAALKQSINDRFYDPASGLYSTYLLSDGVNEIRVHRYDLLGESLTILLGVAGQTRAEAMLKNYPVGPHGPPVVWPEEQTVPIYHNQAIWPFVTAFWIKAARQVDDCAAVNLGIRSLEHLAALNLSNMENFDFVTGKTEVKDGVLSGPVVDSRRQLWSVAGYLSMVQDVIFGLQTSWDGIRFQPFITAKLRNEMFAGTDQIELRNLLYRGTCNQVHVHLPSEKAEDKGFYPVSRIKLNGKIIGDKFVPRVALQNTNQWDIYLTNPQLPENPMPLRMVDVTNKRALFGPLQPVWDETQDGGITVTNGKLVLHFQESDPDDVVFNIYRDGMLYAKAIHETNWVDAESDDYLNHVHCYAVEAVDVKTGTASYLTPIRCHRTDKQEQIIPARDMQNHGGKLVEGNYFEDWGRPEDELWVKHFKVSRSGRYLVRAQFSNGSGPVNTGIACAVKKLEVRNANTGKIITSGYLVMPQSGDWKRWDLSSPVDVKLNALEEYSIHISEDGCCRNMSYFKKNERYTAWPGGGANDCNFVNIAAIHLLEMESSSYLPPPQLSYYRD